jgi:hypothetical protein
MRVEQNGTEEDKRKEQFLDLAELFRSATDPTEVSLLGDELGRVIFG